jgi:hypothetical protein
MYFPAMSYLKSQVIPESHRANVMNWFRVPMNLITCTALLSLNLEILAHDKRAMFVFCFCLAIVGIFISTSFIRVMSNVTSVPHVVDMSDPSSSIEKAGLLAANNETSDDNIL